MRSMEEVYAEIKTIEANLQIELSRIRGEKLPSGGEIMANMILGQTKPDYKLGVTHAGNWPAWALAALEYETFHRDFGNRSSGVTLKFFISDEELDIWIADENQHIADIDYAYRLQGKKYSWDWGPVFEGSVGLG